VTTKECAGLTVAGGECLGESCDKISGGKEEGGRGEKVIGQEKQGKSVTRGTRRIEGSIQSEVRGETGTVKKRGS